MAHMLLVNPRRRKARRAAPKRSRSAAPRRRRARRANPAPALSFSPVRRRRRLNPLRARRHTARRRRNPIGGGNGGARFDIVKLLTEAAIGGVAALSVDVAWGKLNPMLPTSMQTSATGVGLGDALKALATALLASKPVNRATKGWGAKIARASLTVQARDIASTFLPATMGVAGVGFFAPGRVVSANARINPNMGIQRSASPLLNRYTRPGVTPLLNAAQTGQPSAFRPNTSNTMAMNEGVRYR